MEGPLKIEGRYLENQNYICQKRLFFSESKKVFSPSFTFLQIFLK